MTRHDFRDIKDRWGWTILSFKREADANYAQVEGFGRGLQVGDEIVIGDLESETTSRIEEISYEPNPNDWWKARLKWISKRTVQGWPSSSVV